MGFDLGGVFDFLGGGKTPKSYPSGAFTNIGDLGDAYSKFLLGRLTGDITKSPEFGIMDATLRDTLSREARGAKQSASDAAVTGGYMDSGALPSTLGEIDRSRIQAYASGLRDILLNLEMRRTSEILPYLSGASQEKLGVSGQNIQGALGERGQNLDFLSSVIQTYGGKGQ